MLICTTKQIAEIFSITDRAVRLWADKGCPREGHGKWDMKDVLNWWLENLYQSSEDGEALAEAKLAYWEAKARSEKVKADEAEKAVMKIDDFKAAWVWRVAEMFTGLRGWTMRLATMLVNQPETEVRRILREESRAASEKFSRAGTLTPEEEKKKPKKGRKK